MTKKKKPDTGAKHISSWAVPTKADDRIWNAMTRVQQNEATRKHFAHSNCSTPTNTTIAEIVEKCRIARRTQDLDEATIQAITETEVPEQYTFLDRTPKDE